MDNNCLKKDAIPWSEYYLKNKVLGGDRHKIIQFFNLEFIAYIPVETGSKNYEITCNNRETGLVIRREFDTIRECKIFISKIIRAKVCDKYEREL